MRLIILVFFILTTGCQLSSTQNVEPANKEMTEQQWFLYHLHSEAKCGFWHENVTKKNLCLKKSPNYIETTDSYLFEFEFTVESEDDLIFFRISDEKQRLQILREDVNYIVDSWVSFIQLVDLPMISRDRLAQISQKILENIIIRINFNYMGSLSYDRYSGQWHGKTNKITVTKQQKEVLAI